MAVKETTTPLEKARQRMAELRSAGQTAERLSPIERAKRNPGSRSQAIKAMCWDCQGGDADPCVPWRIGNCLVIDCPLMPHRPHRRLAGTPMPVSLRTQ